MVMLLVVAGLLVYGIVALTAPQMMAAGYESYTGTSWAELLDRAPDTAAYLLWVYRLVGGLNVAVGLGLIAIAVEPFRRGDGGLSLGVPEMGPWALPASGPIGET